MFIDSIRRNKRKMSNVKAKHRKYTYHAHRNLKFEGLESRRLLAAVAWDGGGGNSDWNNLLNWDTDTLPGSTDDVIIDILGTPTITHSSGMTTINSLQSQEPLSIQNSNLIVTGSFELGALHL